MPRNSQAVRQLCLLQRLESPRGATLEELVNSITDSDFRHPRTIRRDLRALEDAGVPLVTERVEGHTRWRLMDGYRRLPALRFSPTELMALTVSRHLLKPLQGTELHVSLDSALSKARAALPTESLGYVRKLEELFSVGLGPHKIYRQHRRTIDLLTRAIKQLRTVQMRYYSASRQQTRRREIDPYRLWYASGALYLVAFDHLRQEVRTFAVDRIRSLILTDHAYQLPLGFDMDAYVREALVVMRGRPVIVELVFDKPTAAWVKDRIWHSSQNMTPLKGGRLKMTLRVADTPELIGWILSFGAGVRVLGPTALKAKVREEARKILRQK